MIKIKGKFEEAIIYNDEVEDEALSQIKNLLDQPMAENSNVRIMSDVHSGSGCVIGYTAKITDKIVPNLIGVDIGCGISSWKLGHEKKIGLDFDRLDRVVKMYIPSGRDVKSGSPNFPIMEMILSSFSGMSFNNFHNDVSEICKKIGVEEKRVWKAVGTLGGGNHFIEINKDEKGFLYLTIHSGSRNFGLKVANYHQDIATKSVNGMSREDYEAKLEVIKKTKSGFEISESIHNLKKAFSVKSKPTGLEYLEGDKAKDYYKDMQAAQLYAQLSRRVMGFEILSRRYKMEYFEPIESVHNYINFEDGIIRKGAISAHKGEQVVIPMNMAFGCVLGEGKGNENYNFSAPHGAGRKMSRTKAKNTLTMDKYQEDMDGIYSSCINTSTLDECPDAYKSPEEVLDYMKDTVDVKHILKSIYNFKATE